MWGDSNVWGGGEHRKFQPSKIRTIVQTTNLLSYLISYRAIRRAEGEPYPF